MPILDLFFPKKCVVCKKIGEYVCDNCFSYLSFDTKSICLACKRPSLTGLTHPACKNRYSIDGSFSSISYNKTAQKLIYSFKNRPYVTSLEKILSELFYEGLIQNENFIKELKRGKWTIVSVPLAKNILRKRSFNQSEILAKELGKKFNLGVSEFKGKIFENIFLIDDFIITGSTLNEMTKVLKKEGAKRVIGLTLARD